MNPQEEKMLERITDTLGDDVQSHKEFNMLKLAKVLVEMEERMDLGPWKWVKMGRGDQATPETGVSSRMDGETIGMSAQQDPYLTALDDVEKRVKPVKEPLLMTCDVMELIEDLRKKHNE